MASQKDLIYSLFRRIYGYRARAFRAIPACISLLNKLPLFTKVPGKGIQNPGSGEGGGGT
jgi:hypothetical protein